MRFSTLIIGACAAAAAVLPSPIKVAERIGEGLQAHLEVGHVTDADGKSYDLTNTGVPNIHVITSDRKDGYYVRPLAYHVAADHVCKFYMESTRGVGPLIGEFKGPVDADFGADWAVFYECWHVAFALQARSAAEAECGFVIAPDGGQMALNPTSDSKSVTRFDVNEQLIIPVIYNVAEHCHCDFSVQPGRGGASPPVPYDGPAIGEFGIYRPWAYNCHFTPA